ncbi:uncharacterized protein LOC144440158 [Glandiceps talaboti]
MGNSNIQDNLIWAFLAQSTLLVLCFIPTCCSLPKDKYPSFPAPPTHSTQSPDDILDIVNVLFKNMEEHQNGYYDGMTWYFGDGTPPPAPEIPDLPEPHEEKAELPKVFPTFNPKVQWDLTVMPTMYVDNSYYNSTVTSSSFIAVAIAIVVILIISMIVTIYAIKARKRGVLIMTVRRSLQRNADLYPPLTDSDRSLLVRPAPIVYVEDSRMRTVPSSGPEPPPYSEHQEVLLPPADSPPPYTATLNVDCNVQDDVTQTVTNTGPSSEGNSQV